MTNQLSTTQILSLSQYYGKDALRLLAYLLRCAKNDFRTNPEKYTPAVERIMKSQRLVERNVNPQMVLDVLLMNLTTK